MVYIGIDYGDKRIGISRSDGILATAVGTVCITGIADAVTKVAEEIQKLGGQCIVIGLPRNMDSTEGFRAERTRRFGDMLAEKTGIAPVYFDERLTTSQAYVYMNEVDFKAKKRRGTIDALSSKIILQDYLDSISPR